MSNKIDWSLWDNTEEAGQQIPKIEVGPHICTVLGFDDVEDKQYIKIRIDVTQGNFKGYFKKLNDMNKEWPNAGHIYRSYKPSAYPFLKNFVRSLEKSNEGYSFKAVKGDFESFIGKQFVGVFGEEETPYPDDNGNPTITIKIQSVRSIEALQEGKITIPELKKLSDDQMEEFEKRLHTENVVKERQAEKLEVKKETEEFYEASKQLASEEDLPF